MVAGGLLLFLISASEGQAEEKLSHQEWELNDLERHIAFHCRVGNKEWARDQYETLRKKRAELGDRVNSR